MPKRAGGQDFNQAVHAIFEHVAAGEKPGADGQVKTEVEHEKDPAAVSLGRRGGLKGGRKRMDSLTSEEKTALGQRAAQARWGKPKRDT